MFFFLWLFRFLKAPLELNKLGNEGQNSILSESDLRDIQDIVVDSSSFTGHFDKLGHGVNRKIFEYLIYDFASIRLVCKSFRRSFDDANFATCSQLIPGFTRSNFSQWNDVPNYFKYQLILLTNAIPSFNYADFNTSLCLKTDVHLNAIKIIKFLKTKNLETSLKLANAFLKLKIVLWGEIYHLFFSNSFENIPEVWSLGLTTISREMAYYNEEKFRKSLEYCLFRPIDARKYGLSRFTIAYMIRHEIYCSIFDIPIIFKMLIRAQYWDLLHEFNEMNKNRLGFHWFIRDVLDCMAEEGHKGGLKFFRIQAKRRSRQLVILAASNGRLEFLQELDELGLLEINSSQLVKEYVSAILGAITKGHTECLEFLVNRFGTKYLDTVDENGYMPLHHAILYKYPETLSAIIKLHPYYQPKGFCFRRTSSPLNIALSLGHSETAKVLIKSFPELINLHGHHIVYMAVSLGKIDVLEMVLKLAKPETITAKFESGETALHGATYSKKRTKTIPLLLKTGLFNVMDRDNSGQTPVAIFKSINRSTTRTELMRIFNLESEEQLTESLKIRK